MSHLPAVNDIDALLTNTADPGQIYFDRSRYQQDCRIIRMQLELSDLSERLSLLESLYLD